MYIDATSVAGADRRFEGEVVRLIRAAMHPLEARVERIRVQVSSSAEGHVCRLHASAERGQMVVVESRAASRLGAIVEAADSLRQTIESRAARSPDGPASGPRSQAGLPPASEKPKNVEGESSGQGPRVLLVLRELDPSNPCVRWAVALTGALRAELAVCRVLPNTVLSNTVLSNTVLSNTVLSNTVLPSTSAADTPPPGKAWLEATRRLLAATRETRRWCADVLPAAELCEPLIMGDDVVAAAALLARQHGAEWIVMADVHDGCGPAAAALALASGCPVLVARAPTTRSTLLVASDGSDDLYPISSRAGALAEALHAPVLAFHDVGYRVPELSSRVNALTDAWALIQAERLEAAGHQRLPELEVLLAHGTDRVETILQQARREDAEIIIVGVSEGAGSADDSLAANVVERAIPSVLVVPSNVARGRQQHGPRDEARRSSPQVAWRAALSEESSRRWRSG